jgi:hypothetical protein
MALSSTEDVAIASDTKGGGSFKGDPEYIERLGHAETHQTFIGKEEIATLPVDHQNYLLKRHGTLDLDPVPSFGDADPYNWPQWKVRRDGFMNIFRLLTPLFRKS